jgi:predicted RNase H-like HicB family nuclease
MSAGGPPMKFNVEIEREDDGRWIADVVDLPGAMAYGQTREQAVSRAEALALRILADRLENGESLPTLENVFSVPA